MSAPEYITEISAPQPVIVLQVLRSRMLEPEPTPESEPEAEAGR